MMSLREFADHMTQAAAMLPMTAHESLERACELVLQEAKSYPGSYQSGWPALQASTIARKATGDSPLLETGELRDSYQTQISMEDGWVGSNNMKAVWHELGTRTIPPRPILTLAAKAKIDDIVELTGRAFVMTIISGNYQGTYGKGGPSILYRQGTNSHVVTAGKYGSSVE